MTTKCVVAVAQGLLLGHCYRFSKKQQRIFKLILIQISALKRVLND